MSSESIDKPKPKKESSGCSCLILTLIGLFLFTFIFELPHRLYHSSGYGARVKCVSQLKSLDTVLNLYVKEHNGKYPHLSPEPGELMMNSDELVPEYLSDGYLLVCPGIWKTRNQTTNEYRVDDQSFYYFSHAIRTEAEGLAYVEAYRTAALEGKGFDHDFVLENGTVIPRIQLDENTLSEAYKIPVLIEKIENHPMDSYLHRTLASTHSQSITGAHVLFLNGRIEFMELDSGFPMTTKFLDALKSIDE